jgi:GST-like protein
MTDSNYQPPKVWQWQQNDDNKFASINRPIAGPTQQKELPSGKHPHQLYSLATPNGVKVTIMFEELLALGFEDAEYDAYYVDIMEGDQFTSGFVDINPNSKIPAMVDNSTGQPTPVFESGAILLYLAEKFGSFLPADPAQKAQCMSWLFWQVGTAPILGGGFGHFYAYADEKQEYPINRFTMEVKRQLDVLNRHLEHNEYICNDQYTIADMAIWPWIAPVLANNIYEAAEFLEAHTYTHVLRWAEQIEQRCAVKRGKMVNRSWGEPETQLKERHSAADFDHIGQ